MLWVQITSPTHCKQLEHPSGPLEFGRVPVEDGHRIVLDDPYVSRNQLRVEERKGGRVAVENLSNRISVYCDDGAKLDPGESREMLLPARLTVGKTLIELTAGDDPVPNQEWQTIRQPIRRTVMISDSVNLAGIGDAPPAERLAHWFETVISVQRAAAGSAEFYAETARALVKLVGLDRGMVLLRRVDPAGRSHWEVAASHSTDAGSKSHFSHTILNRMIEERRTFFRAAETAQVTESLVGVESVVVSPIFDHQDAVVGAIYGLRTQAFGRYGPGIRPLEAQVVQLLAAAVGAGLARQQREAEAARSRVQFEQFFSSSLARELERDPALLDGRDCEVTILFSDIRGFSEASERLGPEETCRLVGDVMERLTARVVEHSGVLVDYVGDGLLAMWNAPTQQADHATLACQAALEMLADLPELTAMWQDRLGAPLALGIGLNTGVARVGNTGSRRRFKYGPLGHTVNLASRVQGATKFLGVPILVTGTTCALVQTGFATRRLCKAHLKGIATSVDLYELHAAIPDPDWLLERDAYESALALYEAGRWADACRAIYPVLKERADGFDVASLTLVGRAVECLKSPPEDFDPEWEFDQK